MEGSARDASPHVDTTLTFSSAKETVPLPYVWSYGMGAESTAAIHRMLTHPDARPSTIAPDFTNLVIVIAQTGDEWNSELVEQYMLPLLRKHNVRLVEIARNGPTKKDGITVLQDSRQPRRLHLSGVFKLSDENRTTGTMPQLGGVRKCSQKAKGTPLDMWRANEFGDRQYFHAIGFNRDEYTRIKRDKAYSMGGQRIPTYPIYEWRWTRQDCIAYLKRELNVPWAWPKSCCRQCLLTALLLCIDWTESPPVSARSVLRSRVSRLYVPRREDDLVRGSGLGVVGRRSETGHARRHAGAHRRRSRPGGREWLPAVRGGQSLVA